MRPTSIKVALIALASVGILIPAVSLGSSFLYVQDNGNVGINNDSPQSKLDVAGSLYSRLVIASSSTIDWNLGNVQSLTLTSSPTLTFTNGQAGGEYHLIVNQDSTGGRTITWPASVMWPGGTPPSLTSLASSTDLINFVYDGSRYLGSYSLNEEPPIADISFDAVSSKLTGTGTNTFTPGTCSDHVFIIWIEGEDANTDNVTGVTVDGNAATQVVKGQTSTGGDYLYGYIHLGGGDGASHNFIVSTSASSPAYNVVSYCGVNQSTTVDNTATDLNQSVSSTHNSNITTNTAGAWPLIYTSQSASDTGSLTSGGSTRQSLTGSNNLIGDSNAAISPAGSHTFTVTVSGGATTIGSLLISLAPAP